MNKVFFKVTLAALTYLFIFSACQRNETSGSFDILDFPDDTTAAAEIVSQANEDLNKIKVMYRKNEVYRDELISSMGEKDVEKVKKITEDFAYLINDAMKLGEEAVDKISRAQQMKIDAAFKEYLGLKEESLRKQLEAFESRRQALLLLRNVFGTNDPALVEKAKLEFKGKEESFAKTMEESKKISKKANEFAKENSKKVKE
jgi:predicted RNA-binding protein with RPS1 domain